MAERFNVEESFSNDRDTVIVDDFVIQHTDGRKETTLWVKGKGWLTLQQIEEQLREVRQ